VGDYSDIDFEFDTFTNLNKVVNSIKKARVPPTAQFDEQKFPHIQKLSVPTQQKADHDTMISKKISTLDIANIRAREIASQLSLEEQVSWLFSRCPWSLRFLALDCPAAR
jgi:hypothetical protein